MKTLIFISVFLIISSESSLDQSPKSTIVLSEIESLLKILEQKISFSEPNPVLITLSQDLDDIKTGDELGIRAGGEPPLKTGEAPRNTIVASTKMRFKIPDMNA